MTDIDVPDWVVEQAAMAVERSHHPEWSDEQFGVWWNFDPLFCERKTSWNGYENMTRKEKAIATARIAITAALSAWVVPAPALHISERCAACGDVLHASVSSDNHYTLRQEKPE